MHTTRRYFVWVSLSILCAIWGKAYAAIPCTTDVDCFIEGATCERSQAQCVCPDGFIFNGAITACLPIIGSPYSSECIEDVQCSARMILGAACVSNTCVCTEGFHYFHGRCWNTKGLGEYCTRDEQCQVNPNHEAASCVQSKCACSTPDFYQRGNTDCRRIGKKVGDECGLDMDCQSEADDLKCSSKFKCELSKENETSMERNELSTRLAEEDDVLTPSDHKPSSEEVSKQALLGPCVDDCRSIDNTECVGKTCVCVHGYYVKEAMCVKELGEACSKAEDCNHIDDSICRIASDGEDGVCSCPAHMTPLTNNRECVPMKEIGKTCVLAKPEACTNYGAACSCLTATGSVRRTCQCLPKFHLQENYQLCWKSRGLNESCFEDEDCYTEHGPTICNASRACECKEGYQPTQDHTDCVKPPNKLGDFCLEDENCLGLDEASRCVEEACVCMPGYFDHPRPSRGQSCKTGIGGNCTDVADCDVEFSTCNGNPGSCNCKANYVSSDDRQQCLPVATEEGHKCIVFAQCQKRLGNGSNCTEEGLCMCLQGYHYDDKTCWSTKRLGEKCSGEYECYWEKNWGRAECRNSLCQCLLTSKISSNYTRCDSGNAASQQSILTLSGVLLLVFTVSRLI